jgi:hypothetical protein
VKRHFVCYCLLKDATILLDHFIKSYFGDLRRSLFVVSDKATFYSDWHVKSLQPNVEQQPADM